MSHGPGPELGNAASILRRCRSVLFLIPLHLAGIVAAFPPLKASDFAAYYTAAWLLRHGIPVFPWADAILHARAAGIPAAAFATAYRNPPYFAFALIPLTYLPYTVARWAWSLLLLSLLVYTAVLMARRFRTPMFWTVVMTLSFPPVTLGLAWGNIACILPLALLLLARASRTAATRFVDLILYTLIACIKLFPLLWLWIPMMRRRLRLLGVVGLAVSGLWLANWLLPHSPSASFPVSLLRDSAWILDPHDLRIGQPNTWTLTLLLTQGGSFRYDRRGISVEKPVSALVRLDVTESRAVAVATTSLAIILTIGIATLVLVEGRTGHAIWLLPILLCVALPVTQYHYLAVVLPAAVESLRSRSRTTRSLALIGVVLVEMVRFSDFLIAVSLHPWIMLLAGFLGVPILAVALYTDPAQEDLGGREGVPTVHPDTPNDSSSSRA